MGFFEADQGWGRGVKKASKKDALPKICHTYPTMIKLGTVIHYIKKFQTYMNHLTHPLSSADISIFFTGNQQILLCQEIHIQIPFRYIISNYSNFS